MNDHLGPEPYKTFSQLYWGALLQDVIPFWDRHSPDRECGGFFTCLERTGRVYDTDKFIWLQARQCRALTTQQLVLPNPKGL